MRLENIARKSITKNTGMLQIVCVCVCVLFIIVHSSIVGLENGGIFTFSKDHIPDVLYCIIYR